MKILMVEDEPDLRECLATCLEMHGHEVIQANDANEAKEKLSQDSEKDFRVLCTDYDLPFKNGAQLIIDVVHSHTQVKYYILFSGRNINKPIAELQKYKINTSIHFLEKPFRLDELEELIDHFELLELEGIV